MVVFTQWTEGFILIAIFAFIILVPCIFSAILGKKLIEQLGRYPTKAPLIQMGVFWKFVTLEAITFTGFFIIYRVLAL